jgi:hypothetical protein
MPPAARCRGQLPPIRWGNIWAGVHSADSLYSLVHQHFGRESPCRCLGRRSQEERRHAVSSFGLNRIVDEWPRGEVQAGQAADFVGIRVRCGSDLFRSRSQVVTARLFQP